MESSPEAVQAPPLQHTERELRAMEKFTVAAAKLSLPALPPNSARIDVSFSSYLRPRPVVAADAELCIFDARRYFSENSDQKPPRQLDKTVSGGDFSPPPLPPRADGYARNCTPTASSEASWNSRTGLLVNPPGAVALSVKNLPERRKTKWFFRRKCPCSGKKSVDVEERFSQPPKTPTCLNQKKESVLLTEKSGFADEEMGNTKKVAAEKEVRRFPPEMGRRVVQSGRPFSDAGSFSFPILAPAAEVSSPPRESLEVFRPPEGRKSGEFPKRADVARRSFTFSASPTARVAAEDDIASDSSSDLFEIESFSTGSAAYRRRESLDETGRGGPAHGLGLNFRRSLDETAAAPEIYEPSEVSVEWSVATADGFERGSVANFSASASDLDGPAAAERGGTGGASGGVAGGRRKGSVLLSCQCEKAVSVGPIPVKCGPEHPSRTGPARSPIATARMVTMARLATERSLLSRSNSARVSRHRIQR